jgi:hypothetical protein
MAIETDHAGTVQRLKETAQRAWEASHPVDLSDAGLLADLKKRELGLGHLVLDGSADKGRGLIL